MTAADLEAPAASDSLDREAYTAYLQSLTLVKIATLNASAARTRDGEHTRADSEIEPAFAVDHDQRAVFYKYDFTAQIMDTSDVPIGRVQTTVVLVFATERTETDPRIIEHFGATSALMMVHPHLREALSSLASRVGFGGLVLPIITG